ncbi:NAD-dependent protein deacetylase [Allokutzneria multivorans]|uniref:NAD-dependent protein deacetylase n=1 Tax=Allokutzneria multivorans TaxID=1142134 RepID=UPI0031E59E15
MRMRPTLSWTPTEDSSTAVASLADVEEVVAAGGVLVLSGAGLSTESGIPDYRSDTGSLHRHTPMTYQEFVASVDGRQRYWARSHLGWRTIARAQPNSGHRAVAELQANGYINSVLTQNVDGLHQAAGAAGVVELHGSLDRVVCLGCKRISPREELDRRLRAVNPGFTAETSRINPDGDVELPAEAVRGFALVDCADCGGVLKPDVVFFGENVPGERVRHCYELVDEAEAVLVLGSSLTVMSGLRFVRHAAKADKPVLIINHGPTRGDVHAKGRLDMPLGLALTELARSLA